MKVIIKSKIWLYPGNAHSTGSGQAGAWHFVTIDKKLSDKIKKSQEGKKRRGWGSVPVSLQLGKTKWRTSIFPDKDGTYLLPMKLVVRQKEGVARGDTVRISATINE